VFYWRVTKYNPLYHNERDVYLKDEWTSFSDVDGINLTMDEYLLTENAYVNAVFHFMSDMGITTLEISDLEKYNLEEIGQSGQILYPNEMISLFNSIHERDIFSIKNIGHVCRLVLREVLWCKLKYQHSFFVHFGFDYYMYIGCSLKCDKAIEKIIKSGLFVELCESPYS
jgi:hypothetical protein